jgi:hypothetical protein
MATVCLANRLQLLPVALAIGLPRERHAEPGRGNVGDLLPLTGILIVHLIEADSTFAALSNTAYFTSTCHLTIQTHPE